MNAKTIWCAGAFQPASQADEGDRGSQPIMDIASKQQTRVFIQARMSSSRFPGKVLAPFRREPIIDHVVRAAAQALGPDAVVVLTSAEPSDDPLARHLQAARIPVFRGPLDDVLERFRRCARVHPAAWVIRVTADSPLIDPNLIRAAAGFATHTEYDLVTNVFPRTFPKGQSVEMIRAATLESLDTSGLSEDEREHVTPHFYAHPGKFRILNLVARSPCDSGLDLSVDTPEDLRRLERLDGCPRFEVAGVA